MRDINLNVRLDEHERALLTKLRGGLDDSAFIRGLLVAEDGRRRGRINDAAPLCTDPDHLRAVELANDIEKALLKHAALIRAQAAGKKKTPAEQPPGPTEISERAIKAATDAGLPSLLGDHAAPVKEQGTGLPGLLKKVRGGK